MGDPTIAVIMTCHNRRETTLRALDAMRSQGGSARLRAYVTDAGSTDGTPAALAERADVVPLFLGPDVFWNGGMRNSWAAARADGHAYYLWLNDDTMLDGDAVEQLLACDAVLERERGRADRIIVGTTRDPGDGRPTYGGVRRTDPIRPLEFGLVEPGSEAQQADTMNGNVVLVPAEVAERVGNLDPRFTHAIGDFDYGLRAGRRGVEVWVAPGTVATCPRNPPAAPPSDLRTHWRRLTGPKGLPPREWLVFARRYAGPLWPVYAASTYARPLTRTLVGRG